MPIAYQIDIAEKLEDLNIDVEQELGMTLKVENRIEYSRIKTTALLAELEMKNNRAGYIPTIDLAFAWGLNANARRGSDLSKLNDRTVWPDYQYAGISLYWPVFDGLRKRRLIQQNKIRIEQISHQKTQLVNSIQFEVRQTRNNLISNVDQARAQQENMKLAEEVYNHTKIKYQEGVGSNLEVIEADNAYKTAQNNYYTALYDALISQVEYKKALGIIYVPATDEQ
jgi:outer membrane protein TolC